MLLGFAAPAPRHRVRLADARAGVRDGLLLAIAGLVVREMWCPWLDVVRADGADDPGGGVFDGVPDDLVRATTESCSILRSNVRR